MHKIGFIGLGRMGQAICFTLLEHHFPLFVFNRTPEKASPLIAKGAEWCETPILLAESCDIIILCLSDEKAAESLLSDSPQGLLKACRPGLIVIDTGTISPASAERNQEIAEARGLHYVSCPVSGGIEGANQGQLAAIVAAPPALRSRLEPVLNCFASRFTWITQPAQAQQLKILNNLAESINLLGAFEVLQLGLKQGIALDDLTSVLTTCRGRSAYMDVALQFLNSDQQSSDVSLAVRCKDLQLASALIAGSTCYPLSLAAGNLFNTVADHYGPEGDQCEYFNLLNQAER